MAQTAKDIIEQEFGQPLVDVLLGFYQDGYGVCATAQILQVNHKLIYKTEKEYNINLRQQTASHLRLKPEPTPKARQAAALKNSKYFMPNGDIINIAKEAKRLGINKSTLRTRIKRWGALKALVTPKIKHSTTNNFKRQKPMHDVKPLVEAYNAGLAGTDNPNPQDKHITECWKMGKEARIINDAICLIQQKGRHHQNWIQIDHDRSTTTELCDAVKTLDERGMIEYNPRQGNPPNIRIIQKPISLLNKKTP